MVLKSIDSLRFPSHEHMHTHMNPHIVYEVLVIVVMCLCFSCRMDLTTALRMQIARRANINVQEMVKLRPRLRSPFGRNLHVPEINKLKESMVAKQLKLLRKSVLMQIM